MVGPPSDLKSVGGFFYPKFRNRYRVSIAEFALKKSSSVEVEIGTELENVKTTFKHRDKSLIGLGLNTLE